MPSGVYEHKNCIYFTFYDSVTDEILWFGTAKELVEKGQFKSTQQVHHLVHRIKSGRTKSVAVVIDREVLE